MNQIDFKQPRSRVGRPVAYGMPSFVADQQAVAGTNSLLWEQADAAGIDYLEWFEVKYDAAEGRVFMRQKEAQNG